LLPDLLNGKNFLLVQSKITAKLFFQSKLRCRQFIENAKHSRVVKNHGNLKKQTILLTKFLRFSKKYLFSMQLAFLDNLVMKAAQVLQKRCVFAQVCLGSKVNTFFLTLETIVFLPVSARDLPGSKIQPDPVHTHAVDTSPTPADSTNPTSFDPDPCFVAFGSFKNNFCLLK